MNASRLVERTLGIAVFVAMISSCGKPGSVSAPIVLRPAAPPEDSTEADRTVAETASEQSDESSTEVSLADPIAQELLEKVVVEQVDLDVTAPDEYSAGRLLWSAYANKPYESQFDKITTEHWQSNWRDYRAQLVKLATAAGLDAQSLSRCLDKIAPDPTDDTALLPVGAFVARRGSDAVWIIVCKWEWGTDSFEKAGEKRWPTLGHICVWAFTMKDAEEVGYVTCG